MRMWRLKTQEAYKVFRMQSYFTTIKFYKKTLKNYSLNVAKDKNLIL